METRQVVSVYRQCDVLPRGHLVHVWERVNDDGRPFRRGRVVFICRGRRYR